MRDGAPESRHGCTRPSSLLLARVNAITMSDEKTATDVAAGAERDAPQVSENETARLNASGHVQELRQSFSLLSLAGIGLVVGNVWPAIGGSILVAIFNGGPPGVFTRGYIAAPERMADTAALAARGVPCAVVDAQPLPPMESDAVGHPVRSCGRPWV